MDAVLSILLVTAIFATLLQGLGMFQDKLGLSAEHSRKAVHIAMGLVTLTFPWLFHSVLPVLLLAVGNAIFLTLLRQAGPSFAWHKVVCRTERKSWGDICFPLGIGTLFALTHGNPVLYCIPVLILTLADAASALIGMRYGNKQYLTADGTKTTEGSLAFFATAFFGTLLLLLAAFPGSLPSCILISAIMGILTMLFEGIAWRGLDNFFIPIGAYIALKSHLPLSVYDLTGRLLILLLVLAVVIALRRRTTLNGGAILGVALYSYYAWSLGGLAWLIVPLTVFISYRRLLPKRFRNLRNAHSIYGVIAVASSGLIWLLFANERGSAQFLFPYTLAFATHESMIAIAHMKVAALTKARLYAVARSVMRSWWIVCLPLVFLTASDRQLWLKLALAPLLIAVPTLLFHLSRPAGPQGFAANTTSSINRWFRQALIATAGSAAGLLPYFSAVH